MITTVTLNAAIDRTYWVDRWEKGGVHRVKREQNEPGGKGNNVAKVVKCLGGNVQATGFLAGNNGIAIRVGLEDRGISSPFLFIDGESRVCLNIIDDSDGSSTELLERGPEINDLQMQQMMEHLTQLASLSSIVVLSGSLPPGVPMETYRDLALTVKAAGAQVFLDTSGDALIAGIESEPDLIKPNEEEISQLIDLEVVTGSINEMELATKLVRLAERKTLSRVCITLGSKGAIAYMDGNLYRAYGPSIQPVNTVGCGDSFLAGMAYAIEQNSEPAECLRTAIAAATANALDERAGYVDLDVFQTVLSQIRIDQWG
ncbi:1-phosphofructokinase family hexose kinase [Alicyclobacillus fastidiosus]|uniref:Tagatose-6-phosphate kinase n=1 Tax=Alicyclobacillus fastidiosus TaxID=392011 RepID=A0ABY6ZCZ2_9BACL|nr:1-phosphofructokinase family hexose kinase [Alicyclobacillus fastidiosus]WAH40726.1 1-phosphofructokinase family hexose kinase [Alicyclobacillus fastidiosus]GMA62197.1 tagatose-6-phosphate kinase [Alicyclobacillus fastidiosus]